MAHGPTHASVSWSKTQLDARASSTHTPIVHPPQLTHEAYDLFPSVDVKRFCVDTSTYDLFTLCTRTPQILSANKSVAASRPQPRSDHAPLPTSQSRPES